MSIFDALIAEVWASARADNGALLVDFTPPSSDAERAKSALRIPQLEHASQSLRRQIARPKTRVAVPFGECIKQFSGQGGSGEEREGEGGGETREKAFLYVRSLSEAMRYSVSLDEQMKLTQRRALALLRLQETVAALSDLQHLKGFLHSLLTSVTVTPQDASKTTVGGGGAPASTSDDITALYKQYIRTLLGMASCLELQGNPGQAEAVLREAMAVLRDAGERLDTAAKAEAVRLVMQSLKKTSSGNDQTQTKPLSCASSGLNALPPLLAGAHPSLPSASAAVEVRTDARRGRYLVATQNIPAGSAVIVERPYAWSLSLEEMKTHCLHCCSPTLAPQPCPYCSNVVFCSRECSEAALSMYHLAECPVLLHLVPPRHSTRSEGSEGSELTAMALLAFRIVVRAAGLGTVRSQPHAPGTVTLPEDFVRMHADEDADVKKKQKKRKGKDMYAGYAPVFGQVTHSEARTPADLLKRSLTAAYLTRCLEASLEAGLVLDEGREETNDVLQDVRGPLKLTNDQAQLLTSAFLRHLQSCSCNAYQISEQRLENGSVRGASTVELGGACYATVSLVNHACCPNVARHSHGNVCVVRAVRHIPKGAELLDNYGPHYLEDDVQERRAALSRQYMFHCECDACRLDWCCLAGLEQLPTTDTTRRGKLNAEKASELGQRLQASLQGLLRGEATEALDSALRYSAALQAMRHPTQPPCREQVRADQVVTLCWSLAGNKVSFDTNSGPVTGEREAGL